jgi:hypothetical protein
MTIGEKVKQKKSWKSKTFFVCTLLIHIEGDVALSGEKWNQIAQDIKEFADLLQLATR